nr:hypothetical protein [Oceanococcus sp. HetDA_MAG_MS8]
MNNLKPVVVGAAIAAAAFGLYAWMDDPDPVEEFQQSVEEGVEEVGDEIDDAQ